MRVTLVIQKLAGLRGGAERVVAELAVALQARGHDVTIVTYDPTPGHPAFHVGTSRLVNLFPSALRRVAGGVDHAERRDRAERAVSARGNRGVVARAKWSATHGLFARRLASWLRRSPQDVVVGFLPPGISAVAVAASRMGDERPRTIASTHSVPSEDFGATGRWDQNPVTRRTNWWALSSVDVITVLQHEFVTQLPADAQDRAVVLPNAVERPPVGTGAPRQTRILGVGRLSPEKRFDLLIDAFARIAAELPQWTVDIFGDGPERSRLEASIDHHELHGRVTLRGVVDDLTAEYETARILCHPSAFEGFGLAVAEALLSNVAVVASRSCAGVGALVDDRVTGLLVDESSDPVAAFADGLLHAARSSFAEPERRQAIDDLASRLSPATVHDQWEQVLAGGDG